MVSPTQKLLLIKGLSSILESGDVGDSTNTTQMSDAGILASPHFVPNFIRLAVPLWLNAYCSINFLSILKLQTSVLKIQWSFRTDQGVVDIQCQIQPLQTSVVFLAGHHELRIRNQFFCFSWTRISCKNLLSDSQKCLELLGTFLMGWTPVKLSKINNTNDRVVMLIIVIKPAYQQR